MAKFNRLKVWVEEILSHTDLNAEFDNFLSHFAPKWMDSMSETAGAMQSSADPYPSEVLAPADSLEGEVQRLRFMLEQVTGETYWFQKPVRSLADVSDQIVLNTGQWIYDAATPVYVNGTTFKLPDDRTAAYAPGTRVRAVLDGGTIYGTVAQVSAEGTPTETTVVVRWDSGALDATLMWVRPSILSVNNDSLPVAPPRVSTSGGYSILVSDNRRVLFGGGDDPVDYPLPAIGTVPYGWAVTVVNTGTAALTLVGTIGGGANLIIASGEAATIMNKDGEYQRVGQSKHILTPDTTEDGFVPVWDGGTGRGLKAGIPIGVYPNCMVILDGVARLPQVNGSRLTDVIPAMGTVTPDKMAPYTAGDDVLLNAGGGTGGVNSNYVKIAEVLMPRGGTIKTRFTMAGSQYYSYSRIRRDRGGTLSWVGAEQNPILGGGPWPITETLPGWLPGDKISLWAMTVYSSNAPTITDFTLMADEEGRWKPKKI